VAQTNVRHRLSSIDAEARSGSCSECGPVRLYGRPSAWACAEARRVAKQRWRVRHVEHSDALRRNGKGRSAHGLVSRDMATLRGVCVICGDVPLSVVGRGYGCSVRQRQLRLEGADVEMAAPATLDDRTCTGCRKTFGRGELWPQGGNRFCAGCSQRWLREMEASDPVLKASVDLDRELGSLDWLLDNEMI
jgi:hypothetical protein